MKKYTDQDIEKFKNDPLIKLLCAIAGDPSIVDDVIKDLEEESKKGYEKPTCDVIEPKYSNEYIDALADVLLFTEGAFNSAENDGINLKLYQDGFIYNVVFSSIGNILGLQLPYDTVTAIMNIDRNCDMKTMIQKLKTALND